VRQQLQLVPAVEDDQRVGRPAPAEQSAQPLIREDALDEVLAQGGLLQTVLVLDRQVRELRDERFGKQPPAGAGDAPSGVHGHALEPAARRILLQHVSRQVFRLQLPRPRSRECRHARGPVVGALHADEPHPLRGRGHAIRARHEVNRLARRRHAELHLRAHRHPLDEAADGGHQK